jgi:DNA-binding beta-propeller fold protein YncE
MKWLKGATEGIIVADGHGEGDSLTQLSFPQTVLVDHLGNVYVADTNNDRVMCRLKGANEGIIIVGGNRHKEIRGQVRARTGILFDRQVNLYVVDNGNNQVEKFEIN